LIGRREFLGAVAAAAVPSCFPSLMAQSPHSAVSDQPDIVTLFLCGDVMLGRGVDQILPHPGDPRIYEAGTASATTYVELAERAHGPIPRPVDFSYVWGDALPIIRDLPAARIVNLETSITRSARPLPKGINYRMSPDNVGCLTAARMDCCALANNHVLDWGEAGLIETLTTLEKTGIRTAGAGRNAAEADAPAALDLPGGGRMLVFALGSVSSGIPEDWAAGPGRPGVTLLADLSDRTLTRIADRVRAARRPRDRLVASIHWGPNWGYAVPGAQRSFAHGLIDDAGFDVVHGHSSHHAKAIEVYREKLILYGCGDFLTDYEGIAGYEEFRGDLAIGYLPSLSASTGKLAGLRLIPFQLRRFRLNSASRQDALWLRDTLDRESAKLGARVLLNEDGALAVRW